MELCGAWLYANQVFWEHPVQVIDICMQQIVETSIVNLTEMYYFCNGHTPTNTDPALLFVSTFNTAPVPEVVDIKCPIAVM